MRLVLAGAFLIAGASLQYAEVPKITADYTTDQQIKLYESWVQKDPSSVADKILLAGAYIQKTRETTDFGYLQRASKILDQVLTVKQDNEALHMRSVVELTLHHFSEAAEYAGAMVAKSPGDWQSWGTLGDAQMEMGNYDDGRAAFEKMLALKPGLASYNRIGFYRFVTGDAEGGIKYLREAAKASAEFPENKAWCLVDLGNMYFKTGHIDEAEAAFREAIIAFPASHSAHAALGTVLAARGKLEDAVASYRRAQSITPMVQYAGALYDLYTALGKAGLAKEQAGLIDVTAQLEDAAGQKANRTLALIFSNQDRNLVKSLELAQADFEIRRDVYTHDALAWSLFKNHRFEEARVQSEEARKLGAPEPVFHFHAGMIQQALGDHDGARVELEKALALNPNFDFRLAAIAREALKSNAR
jgi:tetratricopeptide (TPR) repeat protein